MSGAVDVLEFGLGVRTAKAVDLEAVIALKLLDRKTKAVIDGIVESARVVAQIVESSLLTAQLLDGIEMADLERNAERERHQWVLEHQHGTLGFRGDRLLDAACAVGGQLVDGALDVQFARNVGQRLMIEIFQRKAEGEGLRPESKSVDRFRRPCFLPFFLVRDEKLVPGKQNVRVVALLS